MSSPRGRSTVGAVVAVLLAVSASVSLSGCGAGVATTSSASCAEKSIELGPSDLTPGGQVDLRVDWMWRTCEDTGGTPRASQDVRVTITPVSTGVPVLLGRPTPTGDRFTVAGRFALPADLPVGDAVLEVSSRDGDGTSVDRSVTITRPRPTANPSPTPTAP